MYVSCATIYVYSVKSSWELVFIVIQKLNSNKVFLSYLIIYTGVLSCINTYYHMTTNNIRIFLLILDFKIGNGRQLKRLLDNMGWILLFLYLLFFNNNTNMRFSSRHRLRLQSVVWTATIWLEISGCNNIVSILLYICIIIC